LRIVKPEARGFVAANIVESYVLFSAKKYSTRIITMIEVKPFCLKSTLQ